MRILIVTFCSLVVGSIFGQTVTGSWKTIDDNTGEAKSVVEIYEQDGKVYGRIADILNPERRDALCEKCEGKDKDKPVLGMLIIKGLEKDGDEYNNGKILDPESGKLYKCYIELDDPNRLKVRGYIGFSLLGRTQYWERAE